MKSKEQFLADIYKKAEEANAKKTVTIKSRKKQYIAMIGAAAAACIIIPVLTTTTKTPIQEVPMPIHRMAEEDVTIKQMMEQQKEAIIVSGKIQEKIKENGTVKLKLHVYECYNESLSGEYEVVYEGQSDSLTKGDEIIAAIKKEKEEWKLVQYQWTK